MVNAMHILVIEDEKKVAEALRKGLETESYRVTVAHTGEEGFFQLNSELAVKAGANSGLSEPDVIPYI